MERADHWKVGVYEGAGFRLSQPGIGRRSDKHENVKGRPARSGRLPPLQKAFVGNLTAAPAHERCRGGLAVVEPLVVGDAPCSSAGVQRDPRVGGHACQGLVSGINEMFDITVVAAFSISSVVVMMRYAKLQRDAERFVQLQAIRLPVVAWVL